MGIGFASPDSGLMSAGTIAGLVVGAAIAAWGVWFGGRAWLVRRRIAAAARRADCDLVTIVRHWAADRTCALCGTPLNRSAIGHHAALLDAGGGTRDWTAIAPETLPLALATCLPVCWNCHIAETFRRMHPELITERDASIVQVSDTM